MQDAWESLAREELIRLRVRGDGWGYRPGTEPYVEPTVLASLALLADPPAKPDHHFAAESAAWLSAIQQDDGALGLSESQPTPHWPTAMALLLWSSLPGFTEERRRASLWLLGSKGTAFSKSPGEPIGHDTTIVGWSWVENTHSWVEPTSLAVLALRKEGLGREVRVREGLRLLRDRAIKTGGWNYGNNVVFGQALRPRPAPTGLALMAAAGVLPRGEVVERAIGYLEQTLPTVRSAQSLCWGILGLSAWGRRPKDAGQWLEESFAESRSRSDVGVQLAYLLLARGSSALNSFGLAKGGS